MELLFSSDYYDEYKKDIYAVSSLPNGYYYRFRYPDKYTSQYIKNHYRERINAQALVIFVTGNKENDQGKKLQFIPIRLATIKHIDIDRDTEMFHVHFELDDFVTVNSEFKELDESPLNEIFFGHQIVQPKYDRTSWKIIVNNLFDYEKALFFKIGIEDSNNQEVKPIIKDSYDSHFEIIEMRDYFIRISIANLCEKKELQEIRSLVSASDISTTLSETIQPGLKYDNRSFKLSGLEIGDQSTRINMIKLRSVILGEEQNDRSIYSVRLLFDVKKSRTRRIRYFFITLVLLFGSGSLFTDYDEFIALSRPAKFFSIVGLMAAAWATSELYSRFNKK